MKFSKNDQLTVSGVDRRRFFRIEDRVSLIVKKVDTIGIASIESAYLEEMQSRVCHNDLDFQKEKILPLATLVAKKYPEVYEYMNFMERRIENLYQILMAVETGLSEAAEYDVDLSAQGLKYLTMDKYKSGDIVSVDMLLHPKKIKVFLFARVVRCQEYGDISQQQYTVALDFLHISEGDREAIVKHIHDLQLKNLHKPN